ncbi:myopalladin isoform X2 [Denticeps clupeoides]|uniref:myopalladin isoform X2 n=1 Tax=Denticeps clupeoides TaxID=299321 RepID=UPI0010A56CD7|nr:myopalladin-like isoform X2 [Denticeps clupeoides]
MQDNSLDQPTSLSQLLRESYLAEAMAHHRRGEMNRSDSSSSRRLVYGTLKGKAEDSGMQEDSQFPDLSAFLSREELDKSVNLARQAIGHEHHEGDRPESIPQQVSSSVVAAPATINVAPEKTETNAPMHPFASDRQPLQTSFSLQDNIIRNNRTPREQPQDLKRPMRNTPYGLETQSKKEFLNKAADFIEELSSLFKANSSKRIRPRACKAHRSRYQTKGQSDGVVFPVSAPDDRERPVLPLSVPVIGETPQVLLKEFHPEESPETEEQTLNPMESIDDVNKMEAESSGQPEAQSMDEPVCDPPHFIQKLKSREVPEGSKVQLDCIVRGFPPPEVRWFCEGKELENSPDIQIINNGELHSLIIAEAFEEDTGRYSCFASNFYGTDSTSAEIYIEGASSSDSDLEHFEHIAQLKKKTPAIVSSSAVSCAEDPPPGLEVTGPQVELPAEVPTLSPADVKSPPPSTQVLSPSLPVQAASLLTSAEVDASSLSSSSSSSSQSAEACSAVPAQEVPSEAAGVPPTSAQTPGPPNTQYIPPSPVLSAPPPSTQNEPSQVISSLLPPLVDSSVSSVPENQNAGSYPQGLDGRPIMAAPVFTKSLQDLYAQEGQLVVLECRVKGVPSPRVEWYREGTVIEDSPDFRILQKKPRSMAESEEICTLVIAEVFPEDSGTFTCTASNKYGTVSSIAGLKVKGNQSVKIESGFTSTNYMGTEKRISELKAFTNPLLDGPQMNCSKPCSSTLSIDPMKSGLAHVDAFSTSMPNLDPLSLGAAHPDMFRSSLPSLDPRSFSKSQVDPPTISTASYSLPTSGLRTHEINPSNFSDLRAPQGSEETVTSCLKTQLERTSVSQRKAKPDPFPAPATAGEATGDQPEPRCAVPLPDPPPSCLKPRIDGVLVNHSETRSTSRVGLRVHFKLPEEEEDDADASSTHSQDDMYPMSANKEPPPVLAKPKLDAVQLQLLHNQVLLEQQQESSPQENPTWSDKAFHEPLKASSQTLYHHKPRPAPFVYPGPTPQFNTIPTPLLNTTPSPMVTPKGSTLTPVNAITTSQMPQIYMAAPTHLSTVTVPNLNMASSLHLSPVAMPQTVTPVPQTPLPHSSIASSIGSPTMPKFGNTTQFNVPLTPTAPMAHGTSLLNLSPLSPLPSPLLPKAPAPQLNISQHPPLSSPLSPTTPHSFSYTRPKEFIAAQTLSPVRSPSPTQSPVPMLQELAAELNLKRSQDISSPLSPTSSGSSFPSAPRVFPTRVLEPPTSPPAYISSPTLVPPAFRNSAFILRPQSPPQASSPTSSSSTPSPIQNPVAFLSSVLPSLPTSPPTNAMGLPKSAPALSHGTLRKTGRGQRPVASDDIHESREALLHDIEKKLCFKDDLMHHHRPQEYKVSSFEQRLMSEIEFRLERTPVEESDDEVQHEEIPTGKCIAPIFDKKLKNFRAMEGVPVTFTCKVVGIPIPKVYWFKDGKQVLKRNERYRKIREGDGTCSLHIETITNDDDGNYTVMAANPQGRISCSGHLIVQTGPVRNRLPMIHSQRVRTRVQEAEGEPVLERFFRPHFLQAPGDMVAHEGKLCRLDCKVSGLPNPELMWLVKGKPIYPDSNHRMLVRENGIHSLIIDPLTQNDGGTYTCIASNKVGQSSFCLELLVVEREVKQAPQFVEKLQNTGIAEGTPVRLECRVVGMPPPIIFWKKDNETIPHSMGRVSVHQDATGYICLLIQPTRKEDAGWYTVSAKNDVGIVSCTARLDIYAQWHKQVPQPMKKATRPGSRYAALTGQGLDIKSAFLSSDNCPILFSSSPTEATLESEEL